MIPRPSPSDAPSVDPGVLRRLRALDPNLVVTWSHYLLDPLTGAPIVAENPLMDPTTGDRAEPGPIVDPHYYLWRKDDGSSHHFFVSLYQYFGHEQVMRLEGDLARRFSPRQILEKARALADRMRESRDKSKRDDIKALARANFKRIQDYAGGKGLHRRARLFSGGGVKNRASKNDVYVPMTSKEAGFETNRN